MADKVILRSDIDDLHIATYGGPDVGLLCAAGKVRKVAYGFVALDSIASSPTSVPPIKPCPWTLLNWTRERSTRG